MLGSIRFNRESIESRFLQITVPDHPAPVFDTTAGPTDTCGTTLAATVSTLNKFMTKDKQRRTQKEAQLRINPAEHGW